MEKWNGDVLDISKTIEQLGLRKCSQLIGLSPAARGGNLAKIPPNQVIDDFGRGSSVESESE